MLVKVLWNATGFLFCGWVIGWISAEFGVGPGALELAIPCSLIAIAETLLSRAPRDRPIRAELIFQSPARLGFRVDENLMHVSEHEEDSVDMFHYMQEWTFEPDFENSWEPQLAMHPGVRGMANGADVSSALAGIPTGTDADVLIPFDLVTNQEFDTSNDQWRASFNDDVAIDGFSDWGAGMDAGLDTSW